MKRLCNRFCNFMQLYATLFFLAAAAAAQEPPSPEMAQEESGAAATSVPPVLLRDVKLQTIGEERFLEELPPGLLFIDATTGKVMVADENDPHGRAVCTCRDIDWHSFTNTARFNGHRLEYNQYWSQVAEGRSLLYRFGTNSWLRLVGDTSGSLANLTVDSYDPTNGVMVITADATDGAVLQVCTNLMEAEAWKTATNATVTAATDAATTWSIDMLGTDAEFYRVLAEVQREAGIHAEKPIHANAGIEMGGERWDDWPDVGAIATNAANAAVAPAVERIGVLETNVANCATIAALVEVAGGVSTNTASISGLDGRVEALEANETYYCRWSSTNVSASKINWIPTENWPSTDIDLRLYPSSCSNFVVGIRGDWEPTNRLHIAMTITRSSTAVPEGGAPGGICIGSRTIATFANTSTRRRYDFNWIPDLKIWTMDCYSMIYMTSEFDSSGKQSSGPLPNNVFLPEFDEEEVSPALAMSPAIAPSLTPLSPAVLQPVAEAVDELDVEEPGEEAE